MKLKDGKAVQSESQPIVSAPICTRIVYKSSRAREEWGTFLLFQKGGGGGGS